MARPEWSECEYLYNKTDDFDGNHSFHCSPVDILALGLRKGLPKAAQEPTENGAENGRRKRRRFPLDVLAILQDVLAILQFRVV